MKRNNEIREEDIFRKMLDTNINGAIAWFETESYEVKRKLYFILIDYIASEIAKKSVSRINFGNLNWIDSNVLDATRSFYALNKEDKIEYLEYTIKSIFEAIDKGVPSNWRRRTKNRSVFNTCKSYFVL